MTFPQIMASGQTGAERAALDWAVTNEVPHEETSSEDFSERAGKNVLHSNGTVIFSLSSKLGGCSRLTVKLARKHQKPWLHIHRKTPMPGMMLVSFIVYNRLTRLNVTGSTTSEEPAIGHFVHQVLDQACGLLLDRETGN